MAPAQYMPYADAAREFALATGVWRMYLAQPADQLTGSLCGGCRLRTQSMLGMAFVHIVVPNFLEVVVQRNHACWDPTPIG